MLKNVSAPGPGLGEVGCGWGSRRYFPVPREQSGTGKQGSGLLLITGAASGAGQELSGPGPSPGAGRSRCAEGRATAAPGLRGTSGGGAWRPCHRRGRQGAGLTGWCRVCPGVDNALLFPRRVTVPRVLQQRPGPLRPPRTVESPEGSIRSPRVPEAVVWGLESWPRRQRVSGVIWEDPASCRGQGAQQEQQQPARGAWGPGWHLGCVNLGEVPM